MRCHGNRQRSTSIRQKQRGRFFGGHASAIAVGALALICALASVSTVANAAPGAQAVTLRLDWLYRSYHAPFFLGLDKGWYSEAGIDLKINEGRGSGNVVQLVGNKSDTFGFAVADAVMRGVQNDIPVLSIATIMPRHADSIFVLKKSGIAAPQALKGRSIATTPGGTSDALMPAFLKGAGLAVEDVVIVPLDPALKVSSLLQGKVDAMNAPAWTLSDFAAVGGANSFLYADYGVHQVGYGIVTNVETASTSPDLIRRFLAVTLRAWDYSVKHPEEALAALENNSAENAKPRVKERNRAELPEVLRLIGPAVPGKTFGTQNEADWASMQRQLVDYRVLKASRPISQYLTNQFID